MTRCVARRGCSGRTRRPTCAARPKPCRIRGSPCWSSRTWPGRGTDTPFERPGAPWIEPRAFALALNDQGLSGVRFVPNRFTPDERQYAGQDCGGVRIILNDWKRFDPIDLDLTLAVVLRRSTRTSGSPKGCCACSLTGRPATPCLPATTCPPFARSGSRNWTSSLRSALGICFTSRHRTFLLAVLENGP